MLKAEFDPTGKQTDFRDVNFYELFDLNADPYDDPCTMDSSNPHP
jgi:hypothetical protein